MAKKVTIDNLASEVEKYLNEYKGDINENLDDITKKVGRMGVQALKTEARSKFDGKDYASGWTSKAEKTRLYTTVTIYNSKLPGLPHLLEFGHAIVRGGRTFGQVKGRSHIEPVEREITSTYEREIISKL